MKKIFIYILSMSVVSGVFAQNHTADSLKLSLKKTTTDTGRINLLVKLSQFYYLQKPDSGLFYATRAQVLSKKIGYQRGDVHSLTQIGFSVYMMGNLPEALQTFLNAQHIALAMNDTWSVARIYDGLSCVYYDENDLNTGIAYARKSEMLFRQVHDYVNVVDELMDVASFSVADNKPGISLAAGKEALALSLKINERTWRSRVLSFIGAAYTMQHNNKLGFSYLYQGFAFASKSDQQLNSITACIALATAYQFINNRDSCIYFAKKGFDLAKRGSFSADVVSSAQLLAQQYYGVNNNQAAYYYKLSAVLKDSLFNMNKARQVVNIQVTEQQHNADLKNAALAYKNKLRLWVVLAALALAIVIILMVWRNNRKQQTANKLLASQKQQIEYTLQQLKITQQQLIQSEKMASLGELTAGIAHEIQNPLNFVNNFSEVNAELIDEMQDEIGKGHLEEVKAIAADIKENEQKINMHGKRADSIVKGMLEHSRTSSGQKELTDINALADEYMRLSYHGLRAKDKSFNAAMDCHLDDSLPKVNLVSQDIGRVLLNLYNNAFYAVSEKKKQAPEGYLPQVTLTTVNKGSFVGITIKDNGIGIPEHIKDKIMQPFFTTKPTGEGTGLGLSLSYDIVVKGHNGTIEVNTAAGDGSEFIIKLPRL